MTEPVLVAEGLNKNFGAVTAARDINIAIPKGAVWSLIGTNGAGKTTFVNMVTGYTKPDQGKILFDGKDITNYSPRKVTRAGIRRSFQIPQLCAELNVLENMLLSLSINADHPPSFWRSAKGQQENERALIVLEQFGISDYRDRLIGELPAGVRKLLDIAMAMAGSPKVMLLDEPTSGVAAEEKFPIMDLVIDALRAADVTIVFVEHDMDIVTRYSERVLAFYNGGIIANDTPEELLADPDVQRYITGGPK
ncbi:MAG: ABC transporter ATP-binding protein [Sneathiella sp.]|uniref:ABC transporter ATP-binding protein n=1 Tax=Sneathiella sp. TaxID=1964365 RepID=UPI0030031B5A